jgi:hypothetical protein
VKFSLSFNNKSFDWGSVLSHSRILLILAALFFVSGLFFFIGDMGGGASSTPSPSIVGSINATNNVSSAAAVADSGSAAVLAKMPAPSSFEHFTYHAGQPVFIAGHCTSAYYTVLVYPAKKDYRKNPQFAVYNVATPCPSVGSFTENLIFSSSGFTEGTSYYLIRAEQGAFGSWYDPY